MQPLRFRTIFPAALSAVVLAAVALGVATAGGDGPGQRPVPSQPPTSTGPTTVTSITGATATSAGPASTRPPLPARIIQWITEQAPMGGGASGPQDEAFMAIREGNCRHALDMAEARTPGDRLPEPARTLYEGAGAACLAAFHGRPELWPRAGSALARLAGRTARLDCLQQAVHRVLERLVTAHQDDPGRGCGGARPARGASWCARGSPGWSPTTGPRPAATGCASRASICRARSASSGASTT
jgi:hypothetical protein